MDVRAYGENRWPATDLRPAELREVLFDALSCLYYFLKDSLQEVLGGRNVPIPHPDVEVRLAVRDLRNAVVSAEQYGGRMGKDADEASKWVPYIQKLIAAAEGSAKDECGFCGQKTYTPYSIQAGWDAEKSAPHCLPACRECEGRLEMEKCEVETDRKVREWLLRVEDNEILSMIVRSAARLCRLAPSLMSSGYRVEVIGRQLRLLWDRPAQKYDAGGVEELKVGELVF